MKTHRLLCCLAAILAFQTATAFAAEKPNILFILCDDLGYGDYGVFFQNARRDRKDRSEPWHLTPQIDTLASEGMQLRDYYCPASVCAPSRASLLLGVHQGHANVRDNQFDKALENNHTLASTLKKAGYATVAIGKYGLQGKGKDAASWPAYPTKRGFDEYFGYVRHRDGHEHYPKEGLYRDKKEVWDNNREISSQLDKCYTADLWTARAKMWIVDHRATHRNQPFFMYLAYDTPNAVLELPTQAYPAGGGTNGGLQWLGTPGHMINTAAGKIDSYYYPDYANATWDHDKNSATPEIPWPDAYKRYASCIQRIDDCVGDLKTLLKQLGLEDNTLVVFTSDNGPEKESYLENKPFSPEFFASFGPFDGIKRDTWEGGIRVGAIVRWPGKVRAGEISPLPCIASDWLATFVDAAGLPIPARADGVSLLPTLTGHGKQRASTVYIEYFHSGKTPNYTAFAPTHRGRQRNQTQALRLGDYIGVRYDVKSADDDFEIYNVVKDSHETNNLGHELPALERDIKTRVLQMRRPDAEAHRPYDDAAVPATPPTTQRLLVPGRLTFATYQGKWPWLPQLETLNAHRHGEITGFDLSVARENKNFDILFTGYFVAPSDGDYTFYLRTDTAALLRIHDATVIDDDFTHTGAEKSAHIRLKAGPHPIRLYYGHRSGERVLKFEYSGPQIDRQPVAGNVLMPAQP
jgi:arylsulfatase A-like enzyme